MLGSSIQHNYAQPDRSNKLLTIGEKKLNERTIDVLSRFKYISGRCEHTWFEFSDHLTFKENTVLNALVELDRPIYVPLKDTILRSFLQPLQNIVSDIWQVQEKRSYLASKHKQIMNFKKESADFNIENDRNLEFFQNQILQELEHCERITKTFAKLVQTIENTKIVYERKLAKKSILTEIVSNAEFSSLEFIDNITDTKVVEEQLEDVQNYIEAYRHISNLADTSSQK